MARLGRQIRTHWRKVAAGAVTLVCVPVLVGVLTNWLTSSDTGTPAQVKLGPDLVLDKLRVRNASYRSVPRDVVRGGQTVQAFQQTKASMPEAVVTVSNTGNRRAVLNAIVFTVRAYGVVDPCQAGAPVAIQGAYDVLLPAPARPGQHLEKDVDRQMPPDGVDRFALHFSVPVQALDRFGHHLYVLDVAARVARTPQPQPLGSIALGAPSLPSADDLSNPLARHPPRWLADCFERHRQVVRRIAAYKGATRDPVLSALAARAAAIDEASATH